jgi:hypothetical protein
MMNSRNRGKAYSGVLLKPIYPITGEELYTVILDERAKGIAPPGSAYKKAFARQSEELTKKLPALFKYYNLKQGDFRSLAFALAMQHVPGFAIAKAPPGAKLRWTPFETALLRFEIEAVQRAASKRSFAHAARLVAKRGHWNARLRKGNNPGETLRRRALMADSKSLDAVNRSYGYTAETASTATAITPEEFVRNYLKMNIRIGVISPEAISA